MIANGKPRIAVYHQHINGGGATQVALYLIEAFLEEGYAVDLIVHDRSGLYSSRIPSEVRVIELQRSSQEVTRVHMLYAFGGSWDMVSRSLFIARKQLDKLLYLPALTRYLRRNRPVAVISNLWQLALTALCARAIAAPETQIIAIFHSSFFYQAAIKRAGSKRPRKWRRFFAYCKRVYLRADALVTVSEGVANDLVGTVGLPREKVRTIYNPVVSEALVARAAGPVGHPWLAVGMPSVILAVGRLSWEKDYRSLLEAFAAVRVHRDVRLIILGEGPERPELEAACAKLGVTAFVDLPGWADNPYAYMSRAAVFVLTSSAEGLPTTLIESMACGCPVVATDCPHGPREILADGRYGALVPVGDIPALVCAIQQSLLEPVNAETLRQRASNFSVEAALHSYKQLIESLELDSSASRQNPVGKIG